MANYTTTANVVLSVNGKQAQKMLAQLQKDARKLEQQIAKAATAGDKATMKKLQRELNTTNRMIQQLQGSTAQAEQVLRHLDRATPKELQKTLRTLQQQLNGIERGSAAWTAHIAKIQKVKAEIAAVNKQMALQQSMWKRLNNWLNNAQTAILGVAAALTGMIMAARKAVNSYAEMEESLANTQKYTGMTREEVERLNAVFKSMDTRLAREQLNLLAQEGGRLGYNTIETVKQYVEAAAIINVALVDLGEGATQTIAKLTNIFGIEEMYGVRDAMLKVGSTVNHLSQNCTAAKPFLVEFAQRMAGIGSTAKMTIPEIMAFAATLDAHGQKVEMSATALQRTIMALYKDTAGMAQKVGLDARELTETLNKSTTEGVMMFLEALQRIGEENALAALSPLFQDLGLDGARVSGVLSNLSAHLDFLKWQLGEAAKAFREGTSATNEYTIFNNTAQAAIDKARKRVGELAVELGEKLYPMMRHIYTSSSAFLRVLSALIDWVIKWKGVLTSAAAAIAAYYSWIMLTKTATIAYNAVVKIGTALHAAWRTALLLGKITLLAFTSGIKSATHAFRLFNAVIKTNPFGLILSAVTLLVVAIKHLIGGTSEYTKKLREAVNTAGSFAEESAKELRTIDELFGALQAAKQGTKEYKEAKDAIISQYGQYLSGLINEKNEIINLEEAYNRLAAAARIAAKERSIKTAKETADQTYTEALKDLATELLQTLLDAGKTHRDAERITNGVVIQLQTTGTLTDDLVEELQSIKGDTWQAQNLSKHPVNTVNRMIDITTEYRTSIEEIERIEHQTNPLADYTQEELSSLIDYLRKAKEEGTEAKLIIDIHGENPQMLTLTQRQIEEYLTEAETRLSALTTNTRGDMVGGNPDFDIDTYTPYVTEAESRKRETEARHNAIKERKEFREALNNTKGEWEREDTQNTADYTAGLIDYRQYLAKKQELLMAYYKAREDIYKNFGLAQEGEEDEDYLELLKRKTEAQLSWEQSYAKLSISQYKREQTAEEHQLQMDYHTPDNAIYGNEEALQQGLFDIRYKYLVKMRDVYTETSEEYVTYQNQIEDLVAAEQLRRQKLYAQRIAKYKQQYEYQSAGERLNQELAILEELHAQSLLTEEEYEQAKADLRRKYAVDNLPESAKPEADSPSALAQQKQRELDQLQSLYDQGLITAEEYEQGKARIEQAYQDKHLKRVRQFGSEQTNQLLDIYEAWKKFFNNTQEDGQNWATRLAALAQGVFAVMFAGMDQYSEYVQAQADIDVAQAEKKYDREIELAEGNTYKTKKLEKQKEAEIARIKNEANRRSYNMQVIQAIAQTATNALNAYGSAAAIPLIGYILAPIAAAMAVAAGAIQVATIRKQQQAAMAQGYSKGGFTPDGDEDEPVGVVHAGEWVASQRLVNDPEARPLLDMLEYAQRNNTSIQWSDSSASGIGRAASWSSRPDSTLPLSEALAYARKTNSVGTLKMEDVSKSITAPMLIGLRAGVDDMDLSEDNNSAHRTRKTQTSRNTAYNTQSSDTSNPSEQSALNTSLSEILSPLSHSISRLNERLNEPFVTVNTVTGDKGIKRAQDEYDKLIRNKSPKSRR